MADREFTVEVRRAADAWVASADGRVATSTTAPGVAVLKLAGRLGFDGRVQANRLQVLEGGNSVWELRGP